MPGELYDNIDKMLNKKNPHTYQPIKPEDMLFLVQYDAWYHFQLGDDKEMEEEKKKRVPSPEDEDKYTDLVKIYNKNREYHNFKPYYAVQAYWDHESKLKSEYSRIGGFFRFLSYFVPNSWTKAGTLRSKISECDRAFRDNGFDPEEVRRDALESSDTAAQHFARNEEIAKYNGKVEKTERELEIDDLKRDKNAFTSTVAQKTARYMNLSALRNDKSISKNEKVELENLKDELIELGVTKFTVDELSYNTEKVSNQAIKDSALKEHVSVDELNNKDKKQGIANKSELKNVTKKNKVVEEILYKKSN